VNGCAHPQTAPVYTREVEDYRHILKPVGLALIALGLLDIGFMIYCIMHQMRYSSSFNIFAVISGIYVWMAHPSYLKVVPRAAAFLVAAIGGALVVFPFLLPLDLQLAELRIDTLKITTGIVVSLVLLGFLLWVYLQLRAPPVLQYYEREKLSTKTPRLAFILGAAIPVAGGIALYLMMHGADAR
jgi:hypothetical protein